MANDYNRREIANSLMEIPIRNTIFLQGVFFSEIRTLEERMIEENISHNEESNGNQPRLIDIRVTRFKNKKQWAEAFKDTTLKCWHCSLAFKGMPCFIPRRVRKTPIGKEYETFGLFCGMACTFSFIKNSAEFIKDKSLTDKLSMLKMVFVELYNKRIQEFKEAPSIYLMEAYGGHIDVVQFKNQLKCINQSMINESKRATN